jgi:hypothetical protein
VNIYDPTSSDPWETTNLSIPRYLFAVAAAGSKAYFAGGYTPTSPGATSIMFTDLMEIYDVNAKSWEVTHLSHARGYMSGTSVGPLVMFGGGWDRTNYLSTVDIYDTRTGTWSLGNLSSARSDVGAATVGNEAFFVGGFDGTNASKAVDIYHLDTNTWSTAQLSVARARCAAITVGTKLLVAGGWQQGIASNIVDIYDSVTDKWTTTTMPVGLDYARGASFGDYAVFSSDVTSTGTGTGIAEIFDTQNGTWTTTSVTGNAIWPAVVSLNNEVLINSWGGALDVFVPEPGTLMLMGAGALMLLRPRRAR